MSDSNEGVLVDTLQGVEHWPLLPAVARGLSFDAGGRRLMHEIDLTLVAGTVTVIIGPNGAGKSLLLRLLHGMIPCSGGTLAWGGRTMTEAVRLRQAMVFQRPVMLRRSVAANLRFALKLRGLESDDRCHALLTEVGLADRATQAARLLSGGEQQRLALARAMAVEPQVLFLDEPTASLDPAATDAIEDIVKRAHQRGTKIVFVTHDMGQARRLADDVVFLHAGRLLEHTQAEQFFRAPASTTARDYIDGRLIF